MVTAIMRDDANALAARLRQHRQRMISPLAAWDPPCPSSVSPTFRSKTRVRRC